MKIPATTEVAMVVTMTPCRFGDVEVVVVLLVSSSKVVAAVIVVVVCMKNSCVGYKVHVVDDADADDCNCKS